ncbi:thioredoxin family protein [Flavobacterium sp.]|uniref:thioredoxin family protein n=1 Tax=Flavobacterium sp. TaxID=239 RepID=UPI0028BD99C9|nr:thioredoxin family protein [Flavobacterium sp.]
MKKAILLFAAVLVFTICTAQKKPIMTSQTTTVQSNDMLVGKYSKKTLLHSPYNLWFNPNYDNYNPSATTISELQKHLEGVTITVFLGTWCEDSQHRVPEFFKVIDAIGFDNSNITLIMVDKSKTTPEQFEKDLNITNVPTFIFYKNGKEINRIVESFMESAEKDMLKIISQQPYKHAYQD